MLNDSLNDEIKPELNQPSFLFPTLPNIFFSTSGADRAVEYGRLDTSHMWLHRLKFILI